jgi:hypothetical protein
MRRSGHTRVRQAELCSAAVATALALAAHERLPQGGIPGVQAPGAMGLDLVPHPGPRGAWLVARSDDGRLVVADRHLEVGGHAIPVRLFARVASDSSERARWWDGRRFGFAGSWAELPAALRIALERHGTLLSCEACEVRPLADLRPAFLVRCPTAAETRGAAPGAAPWPCGALLLSTTSPLCLCGEDDRPLDLPVFAALPEALGLLCRTGGSLRCYVPAAAPCGPEDLALGARPTWLVGVLPFGGLA